MAILTMLVALSEVAQATSELSATVFEKTVPELLPYPQELIPLDGTCLVGVPEAVTDGPPSATELLALDTLRRYVGTAKASLVVRLGSIEEGYEAGWLTAEQRAFLEDPATSDEASCVVVAPDGVTVVGKGKWGMLYGVQTVNQLALEARREGRNEIPCMTVRDWPDMAWRCLSPQLTWYSGWNRLEGYDCGNWTRDEWKWLVDWSLLHKCNAWAQCLCGYWPFTLPGYEESTLDVESYRLNPETGQKEPWRFTHPNIVEEFYPEVIAYARARGVTSYAYMAINSFDGGYMLHHPEVNAGGAAEMLPFAPSVHEYVKAFLERLLDMGFDGFVFENPESYHVPNQNAQCYEAFWAPWANAYGYASVEETDANKPPLGVHVEYHTWLFREFDGIIQEHARRTGKESVDVMLISHFLLQRIMTDAKTREERAKWLALIDEKQGREVRWIVAETNEAEYVDLLGGHRVATLGGRGGSCTNAMRRIASINNNWLHGGMGGDIVYDIKAQQRMCEAGGFGAMGYIFEWTNTEVFGYIAAQYLWRNAGVPGIDSASQTAFLDYAYRRYYGDEVGALVARVMDGGSCVNDAMVLDDVNGAQYPETGKALHRDYQLLAVLADAAELLALEAYRRYAGVDPNLYAPVYDQETFRWDGYDAEADHTFKSERLRHLWVSARRSQEMCEAALAYRRSQRLIAEGAPASAILEHLDKAIAHARLNERIYQINYYDDYHPTDGMCHYLRKALEARRRSFLAAFFPPEAFDELKAWRFATARDPLGWTHIHNMSQPRIEERMLETAALREDPQLLLDAPLAVPVGPGTVVRIAMACDRAGLVELFYATDESPAFTAQPCRFEVSAGAMLRTYALAPEWHGTLTDLRLDPPDGAVLRLASIEVVKTPDPGRLASVTLDMPMPAAARVAADKPLFIPWEKQCDLVPQVAQAQTPGRYLSINIGLTTREDYFRLGVVFTVEAELPDGKREMLFRRALGRRHTGWEHWDVPLGLDAAAARTIKLRLITDGYSRAQDRNAPTWQWGLWGQPQVVEVTQDQQRRVLYDFAEHAGEAVPHVKLDTMRKARCFNGADTDPTGATFALVPPDKVQVLRATKGRDWQWVDGFEAAQVPAYGPYRCYLGSVPSWWAHGDRARFSHPSETHQVKWTTALVPEKRDTAFAFAGSTDYAAGPAELWRRGKHLLTFETGVGEDRRWKSNGAELFYFHYADTRADGIDYGLSGVYVLWLPLAEVDAGESLDLSVRVAGGSPGWFMLHALEGAARYAGPVPLPEPVIPAFAAFTPHKDGASGVTIGEYLVRLAARSGSS